MTPRPLRLAVALALAAAPFLLRAQPADVAAPKRGNARFYELHAQHLERAAQPMGVLFLGDSITEGWRKAPDVWSAAFGRYLPANFGIGGDRTQHVLWRVEDGALDRARPHVVVLLLGINNSAANSGEEIAAANTRLVGLVRAKIPGVKVLLLGIFPIGPRQLGDGRFDDGVTRMAAVRTANALLAKLDDGTSIRFLDLGARFLPGPDGKMPTELMPDQLHPSPAGYRVWAEAMQPLLDEMMRDWTPPAPKAASP